MRKTVHILFHAIVWLLALPGSGLCQPYIEGDSIQLNALDYISGELQWQYSFDNNEWFDFEGGNGLRFVFYPEQDTYLRLKISDPDCPPPYYTDIQFVELEPVPAFQCGELLVDPRDGQAYPTVLIGEQCWMGKNLNTGEMVSGSQNQADTADIEKYCYNNDPENCDDYGGLYQWSQAMDYGTTESSKGICPPGWHLPSDDEWKILEMALGMSESDVNRTGFRGSGVGSSLKEGGDSGFEALLGGGRNSSGGWQFIEGSNYEFGYFYTSSEAANQNYAFRRCIRGDSSAVGRYNSWPKTFGLSVRCVKDD
ncbi:MAG: FISUMP domain-containing protein [Bacteroidales bacterium]